MCEQYARSQSPKSPPTNGKVPVRMSCVTRSTVSDLEKELLKCQLENAQLRQENKKLSDVNKMNTDALKENCMLFKKLKPQRPFLSSERKLYIAGVQLFRCSAPHGKDKCPMHVLNGGSFNEAGFEIDHWTRFTVGYRNVGELTAMCHACHALKSRLERLNSGDEGNGEDEGEDDD